MKPNSYMLCGLSAVTIALGACTTTANTTVNSATGPLSSDERRQVDDGYSAALNRLYDTTPGSRELVRKASGVLVFPNVIAAGFVVGGQYGDGELRVGGVLDGYYRTTSGSFGWQAGAQSKALVFLFMTQDALDRFRASKGWSGGVDASVAALSVGANGELGANAARAPTLAFAMTNSGLMANLTLQGTKVTRIE